MKTKYRVRAMTVEQYGRHKLGREARTLDLTEEEATELASKAGVEVSKEASPRLPKLKGTKKKSPLTDTKED
jgi:hypothetical protein